MSALGPGVWEASSPSRECVVLILVKDRIGLCAYKLMSSFVSSLARRVVRYHSNHQVALRKTPSIGRHNRNNATCFSGGFVDVEK